MASTVVSMKMNAAMERALKSYGTDMASTVVGVLAEEYGFNVEEAISKLNLEKMVVMKRGGAKSKRGPRKSKTRKDEDSESIGSSGSQKVDKPSVQLPFVGIVNEDWCKGVRPKYGLFNQCVNKPLSDSADYCTSCQKHADESATGKPKCGDIRDRASFDGNYMDWTAPNGKQALPYINVAEKQGIDMEVAKSEMMKFFGVDIPEEQLTKKVMKRGRKPSSKKESVEGGLLEQVKEQVKAKKAAKKAAASSDTASIASDGVDVSDVKPTEVKADLVKNLTEGKSIRAKPKTKKVVKKVSPAPAPAPAPVEEEEKEVVASPASVKLASPPVMEAVQDASDDDDDDEVEANFKHDGKWYYKDDEDNIFSVEGDDAGEHIGFYDAEKDAIVPVEE